MNADTYTEPVRAFDPSGDPLLTVRCHPAAQPGDPSSVLAMRVEQDSPWPWLVLTGSAIATPMSDREVTDWPIAHPATWSPQLRRDLEHLRALVRKENA